MKKIFKQIIFILGVIILSPLILLIFIIFFIPYQLRKINLFRQVKREWIDKGKFILFIYSENPEWKAYAEQYIIPKIAPYAIILNWSQKKGWVKIYKFRV